MLASSFASRVLSLNARDEWRKVCVHVRVHVFVCMCVCVCVLCVCVRICVCSATPLAMPFSIYSSPQLETKTWQTPFLLKYRRYTTHTRKYKLVLESVFNFSTSTNAFMISNTHMCIWLIYICTSFWTCIKIVFKNQKSWKHLNLYKFLNMYLWWLFGKTIIILYFISQELYHTRELEELRRILLDLVPTRYARQLILGWLS